MTQDDTRWHKMTQDDTRWHKMIPIIIDVHSIFISAFDNSTIDTFSWVYILKVPSVGVLCTMYTILCTLYTNIDYPTRLSFEVKLLFIK